MEANVVAKSANGVPDPACRGIVYNFQRYTVHDGPGTRTTMFLKGCTMNCLWCCNPESWFLCPEVGVYPQRCIGVDKCGYCLDACPLNIKDIFRVSEEGIVESIDRKLCTCCLKCADECPANALTPWGKEMSVEQVLREACKDIAFFNETGGGVTISGGEPFVQWKFTVELLKAFKNSGVHTCVETALGVDWSTVEPALPYIDFVLTDIKHMDPIKHLQYTGCNLQPVLDNLQRLGKSDIQTVIRIPLVPNHNDSEENIHQTGRFITDSFKSRPQQVQVLQFHELGKTKFSTLGKSYPLENFEKPPRKIYEASLKSAVTILRSYGLPAFIGTNVKMTR